MRPSAVSESELFEFAKRVELTATRFLEGHHRSTRQGQGIEFETMTSYSEGDEARFINWKHYAATDRYVINRFRSQERSSWTILIDKTESMNYRTKLQWGSEFAASLLFVARVWGDPWRLLPDEEVDLENAYRMLLNGSAGLVNLSEVRKLSSRVSDRLIFISDFMWDTRELSELMHEFSAQFSTISLIHVLDPTERIFDFDRVSEFKDLESAAKMILDPRTARQLYVEELEHQRQAIRETSRKIPGSFYYDVSTSEPQIDILEELFEDL